jgi:hypothetical protein
MLDASATAVKMKTGWKKHESSVFQIPSLPSRKPNTELDVAYQSLETMRKLNLEVQCQECSIPKCIDRFGA